MKIRDIIAVAIAGFIFISITGIAKAEVITGADGSKIKEREVVEGFVTHYYKTVTVQNKISNRTCNEVDVPIYQNEGKASTGEVLGGAIIGGVIGNQIGKGKGNDAATVLGAIIGADIANKKKGNKVIVGYKRTTVCEDNPTWVTEKKNVYTHSIIRVTDNNGKQYDIQFIAENR